METICRHFHKNYDRRTRFLSMIWWLVVTFLIAAKPATSFLRHAMYPQTIIANFSNRSELRCARTVSTTPENDALYKELCEEIASIAEELWDGADNIPRQSSTTVVSDEKGVPRLCEGEAELPSHVPFCERGDYFRELALGGCPRAQHSYALLLWSGFAGVQSSPTESAKFHSAAAYQQHLDGMAVFGGCLRTGTGIKKKKKPKPKTNRVALGLKVIEFCASIGNPTGVNKQATLLESNGNDSQAVKLYEACLESGRVNALLLFNLGWCLVNAAENTERDRGIALWKEATDMAPDEGSEEAAWNLYQEYVRDDPKEAQRWLDLAEELGYCE